jgi:IMP dehydrogenase
MKEALSFHDVLLVPKYSDIASRSKIDIGNHLGKNINLALPVISSPMDTITELEMAKCLHYHGGLGIVHRYNTIAEQAAIIKSFNLGCARGNIGAAVGVTGDFEERACAAVDAGANIICIDVAHGHHSSVKVALETLRGVFGGDIHIMAGNVATLEGFNELADWGADSIRVGIGGGSICSTRVQTGHGIPTFQSILECSRSSRDAKIIADGGIRSNGDIVKALAAGADFVMLGSMLAGTTESPGEIFHSKNKKYKVYRGMASKAAQDDWRGKSSAPEGISTTIPFKGAVENILDNMIGNLQSGFSYSGATCIEELWIKAEFIKQTSAGQVESSTHIIRGS